MLKVGQEINGAEQVQRFRFDHIQEIARRRCGLCIGFSTGGWRGEVKCRFLFERGRANAAHMDAYTVPGKLETSIDASSTRSCCVHLCGQASEHTMIVHVRKYPLPIPAIRDASMICRRFRGSVESVCVCQGMAK